MTNGRLVLGAEHVSGLIVKSYFTVKSDFWDLRSVPAMQRSTPHSARFPAPLPSKKSIPTNRSLVVFCGVSGLQQAVTVPVLTWAIRDHEWQVIISSFQQKSSLILARNAALCYRLMQLTFPAFAAPRLTSTVTLNTTENRPWDLAWNVIVGLRCWSSKRCCRLATHSIAKCDDNWQGWCPVLIRCLTLWRPLLPYEYSYKASCARLG